MNKMITYDILCIAMDLVVCIYICICICTCLYLYAVFWGCYRFFSVNRDLYTVPVLTGRPLVGVNETAVRSVSV